MATNAHDNAHGYPTAAKGRSSQAASRGASQPGPVYGYGVGGGAVPGSGFSGAGSASQQAPSDPYASRAAQPGYVAGLHGAVAGSQTQQAYSQGVHGQVAYDQVARAQAAAAHYQIPVTSVPQQMPKKRRGAGFWIAVVIAILAVIAAAVLIATLLLAPGKSARSGQAGQLDGKTAEEIQAELDRIVEDGMFNISIAALVEFSDGASEGDLRIENVPSNPYLMKVDIKRQDTGEQIYETDIIEQNHHIQSDTLDVDLDAGTYECIATFHALDPQTEEEVGQAAAAMTIRVLG